MFTSGADCYRMFYVQNTAPVAHTGTLYESRASSCASLTSTLRGPNQAGFASSDTVGVNLADQATLTQNIANTSSQPIFTYVAASGQPITWTDASSSPPIIGPDMAASS